MFWTFFYILIACECGERVSSAFGEIGYVVCQFDWCLFPVEMWKMLPTILIFAQQPVEIPIFGSISCTRETFKKVCQFHSFWKLFC